MLVNKTEKDGLESTCSTDEMAETLPVHLITVNQLFRFREGRGFD